MDNIHSKPKEEITADNLQQNIIASAIISIGLVASAAVLAYFPGSSSAQARAASTNSSVSSAQTYTNADGRC